MADACFCNLLCGEPESDVHVCRMVSQELTFNPHLILPTSGTIYFTKSDKDRLFNLRTACALVDYVLRGYTVCAEAKSDAISVLRDAQNLLKASDHY